MNFNMNSKGRVTINGNTYIGNDVTIQNGTVIIDGKAQEGTLSEVVNVEVHGDVKHLENHAGDVKCGSAGEVNTGSGDVNVGGDVSGSIRTGSGDVICGNVSGSIKTGSGDVSYTTTIGD